MAKAEFYTVRESFIGALSGSEVEYHKGDVVAASDPAIKKMPMHFEPLMLRGHERAVEQATAAPGEKRRLSLRRKPAKAKATAKPEPELELKTKPEPEPEGKPITTASFKGKS